MSKGDCTIYKYKIVCIHCAKIMEGYRDAQLRHTSYSVCEKCENLMKKQTKEKQNE